MAPAVGLTSARSRTPSRASPLGVLATPLVVLAFVASAGAAPVVASGPVAPRQSAAHSTSSTPAASTVLVQYRAGATVLERGRARAAARATRTRGRADLGLDVVVPAAGRSVAETVRALRADPAVENAEPNGHMQLAADPALEPWRAPYQWGLENDGGECVQDYPIPCAAGVDIDAVRAWQASTGAGVTVAVLDDGLDFSQPELATQAWVNPGESGPDGQGGQRETNGLDDDGNGYIDDVHGVNLCTRNGDSRTLHVDGVDWHGTAVASILAAAANGDHIAGVAPDARLMAVRWLVAGVCDTTFDAIVAIHYAVANGADVINASWGGPEDSQLFEDALTAAGKAGVLVVAAAGNNGSTSRFYPAASNAPNVISVGAIQPDGYLASFSNRGTWVDLAAPGSAIVAICLSRHSADCGADWSLVYGTSFAAPHVAGVAALVLAIRPELRADAAALRAKLIDSGVRSARIDEGLTGSGRRLNAGNAVDLTPPSAPRITIRARLGSTIGANTVPMSVAWPAATDDHGIDSYRARYRVKGTTTWTTISAGTTSRSVAVTLAVNSTYEIQVIARDRGGNSTAATITTAPKRYSESSPLASYSGRWTLVWGSSYSGGKARTTSTAGRAATFRIAGRGASWVSAVGPTRGSARVYVDGSYVATVSLRAPTTGYRRVVWSVSWAAAGSHVVRIVALGTSGHPRVDVDALVVAR